MCYSLKLLDISQHVFLVPQHSSSLYKLLTMIAFLAPFSCINHCISIPHIIYPYLYHKCTHIPFLSRKHSNNDCLTTAGASSDLKLCQGAIKVEDGVALLQFLSLLLGCGQDHGQVGAVHLKEDGVLAAHRVRQGFPAHQLLVLVIGEVVLWTSHRYVGTCVSR